MFLSIHVLACLFVLYKPIAMIAATTIIAIIVAIISFFLFTFCGSTFVIVSPHTCLFQDTGEKGLASLPDLKRSDVRW